MKALLLQVHGLSSPNTTICLWQESMLGFGYVKSRFTSVTVSDPGKHPAGLQGSRAGEQTQVTAAGRVTIC